MNRIHECLVIFFITMVLSSCANQQTANIRILDAKTALGVDARYRPVQPMKIFPDGTSRIYCWFSWNNAKKDIKILARWYYITDDLPILDYTFTIPRKKGMGSVSLLMPEGKTLPPGLYRVTLELDKRTLKTLTFKVSEK